MTSKISHLQSNNSQSQTKLRQKVVLHANDSGKVRDRAHPTKIKKSSITNQKSPIKKSSIFNHKSKNLQLQIKNHQSKNLQSSITNQKSPIKKSKI